MKNENHVGNWKQVRFTITTTLGTMTYVILFGIGLLAFVYLFPNLFTQTILGYYMTGCLIAALYVARLCWRAGTVA